MGDVECKVFQPDGGNRTFEQYSNMSSVKTNFSIVKLIYFIFFSFKHKINIGSMWNEFDYAPLKYLLVILKVSVVFHLKEPTKKFPNRVVESEWTSNFLDLSSESTTICSAISLYNFINWFMRQFHIYAPLSMICLWHLWNKFLSYESAVTCHEEGQ